MNLDYIMKLDETETVIYITRLFFINLFTYFLNFKIVNKKMCDNIKQKIIIIIIEVLIVIICNIIRKWSNFLYLVISMLIFNSVLFSIRSKNSLGYSLIITIFSLSINYIMYSISAFLDFLILFIVKLENDYINLIIILTIYMILIICFSKIKRIKQGLIFSNEKIRNEYFNLLILNISTVILFSIIILANYELMKSRTLGTGLIIFAIMMAITIQKSLQLYYKQKMLVKDLEETKAELEEKNNKIKELEKEIIKSGKRSHSISHRQKILEHKLEELSMKSEISEMDIKSRIEKIGKDIRKEPVIVLAKTGIVEIDDVLNYMKSECLKKKIDFQLQLSGNIYKMINNYVSKDELEILLADHIKNAIIAIEHSENINKSILVRLGRLDGTYGLYVYDSGIEFEIETFLKLGKKPATTHKDSGGTGMGFMNTFDTLRKHNASFIIEEYGKPVTDNFTKVLKFKFDNKNEFKICTYRKEEIEKQDKEKILKVENLMF